MVGLFCLVGIGGGGGGFGGSKRSDNIGSISGTVVYNLRTEY